jgi:membrane protease YdiL (CAAX protease family)
MTAVTEPMASTSLAPPRIWGFWGTGAWTIAAMAAWAIAQIGAVAVLLAWQQDIDFETLDLGALDVATVIVVATLASAPLQIAVIAGAVRLARTPFRDYLALHGFSRRDFALGFICLLALGLIYDGSVYLLGRDVIPPVMVQMYVSARDSGLMVPFVLAIGVVAPVVEEIVFRGFVYRGWAGSWLGVAGTVLVTAGLWAIMHTQYDWDAIVLIFGIGLLFGWLRWRSGSTSLTIALHIMINLGATAQTAIKVEYFS